MNREGGILSEGLEEMGWSVINGGIRGDEGGEFTFTGGRGDSVIDYVIGEEETWEKVERMDVGEAVMSDYSPLIVKVKREEIRKNGEKKRGDRNTKVVWLEELKGRFKEGIRWKERRAGERVEEEIERMEREFRRAMEAGGGTE